jgi:TonB family protein
MMLVVRVERRRVRKSVSLVVSGSAHAAVLAWVALGPIIPEKRPNLYEQEIRPNASKIVWYNLQQRLPDISPSPLHKDPRPPRALVRAPHELVAGPKDLLRPPQLIYTPAPALETPELLPSPNVVAMARPVRPFSPAPQQPSPARPAPELAEAPKLQTPAAPVPLPPVERPQPRAFKPPPDAPKPATPQPVIPTAPELTVAMANSPASLNALPPMQAARKTFIPPVEAAHAPVAQPVSLPAAPALPANSSAGDATAQGLPGVAMARAVRPFTAPPAETRGAPSGQGTSAASNSPAAPPAVSADNGNLEASLAIVGLSPARGLDVPTPKGSQEAGFSAGPQLRPEGGEGPGQPGGLVIPGLLARSGSGPTGATSGTSDPRPALVAALAPPTALPNLVAAARSARVAEMPVAAALPASTELPRNVKITPAPEPRLEGRVVYSMSVQMPNVTSFSGSWIVWFADRERIGGLASELKAPLPLRKVDPKYIASAFDEKIEGTVRLAAVIRRNGHVDEVELLRHLDGRLDHSAEEALSKWEFEPAERNGKPIEVDAVFEIPFHLAHRLPK